MLRAIDPRVYVVGNPTMPRQSAFEVTMADGTVLWSKLSQPDGRNNQYVPSAKVSVCAYLCVACVGILGVRAR